MHGPPAAASNRGSSLSSQLVAAADEHTLAPADRPNRARRLDALLADAVPDQLREAAAAGPKQKRLRKEEAKSAYRLFFSPLKEKDRAEGHDCMLFTEAGDHFHSGMPHPTFVGSDDAGNL